MGGCVSAAPKAGQAGRSETLTGVADSSSDPLISKTAKNSIPSSKLLEFDLTYDATEAQQESADIVLSMPILQPVGTLPEDGSELDPLDEQRRDLLYRLQRAGLSYSSMKSADGDEAFVIIEASEERLMECAEFSQHEMRLKKSWNVPYAPFSKSRADDFVWENRAENRVFSTRDRQTLIMRILEAGAFESAKDMAVSVTDNLMWKKKYGKNKLPTCGLNLDGCVGDGVLHGYWAMHGHSRRHELLNNWAYSFWKGQPLKMIFEYFNSKTALYFAFTGYYSMWLLMASVFGVAVFLYDYVHTGEFLSATDHNRLVPPFAFFMALWGTLFLEFWKRYNAELAHRWSTTGLEHEASERSEFRRGATATRQGFYSAQGHFVPYGEDLEGDKSCWGTVSSCCMSFTDPVEEDVDENTREQIRLFAPSEVPYMDGGTRTRRWCAMTMVALFFTISVVIILMSFLVMRLIFQATIDAQYGPLMASVLQALCTVVLNVIYKEIAICMVDYENYRTDEEWEDSIISKVFLFQFINSYFSLFYIAFLKGKIGKLDGYSDACMDGEGNDTDNCMGELKILLFSTLLTTQIAGTLAEALAPYAQYKAVEWAERAKWKASGNEGELKLSAIDHESKLVAAWKLDAFTDYNKMALQFGYVSMFVAAFPLAPFFSFLNNVLEIRTDAWKRLVGMQRPAPSERAEDIGYWMQILEMISISAVCTNIGVLVFTSNNFSEDLGLNAEQRVWAFIIIEHVVIAIKLFMALVINDVPEWVTLRLAKDQWMLLHREEMIAKEEIALSKSQERLIQLGGVTLETEGTTTAMKPGAANASDAQ